MKKRPTPFALIGAVVCGIVAIIVFWSYTSSQQAAYQAAIDKVKADLTQQEQDDIAKVRAEKAVVPISTGGPTGPSRRVLYAKQDIDPGVLISPDMFEAKDTPSNLLQEAFTTDDSNTVEKSYSQRPIRKGDPLTEGNVGLEAPHLSERIPIGLKAMTVPALAGDANLTGGFLVDGDTVDLMYLHPDNPEDPKSPMACDAVIQNLPVVYVPGPEQHSSLLDGITPTNSATSPMGLTVEVTLQEAQILSLLQSIPQTKFQMILRSRKDKNIVAARTISAADLQDSLPHVQKTIEKSIFTTNAMANQLKANAEKGTNETSPTPAPQTP